MTIGDEFPAVLAAAQSGDCDAIARLYRETAPAVLGYLRASGAPDPEDLASDVYVSMMSAIGRFEGGEDRFRSWLLTIAHRRLVDGYRRLGRRAESPSPVDVLGHTVVDLRDTESEALTRVRLSGVMEAVERLTDDQRAVLLLRVVADLPVRDIAAVVGKPESAVKGLLRRALATLERQVALDGERGRWEDDATA